MKQSNEGRRPLQTATSIVASSMYATVVTTGALTIGLSLTAWVNGTTFVEYYQYIFPQLRGGVVPAHIPTFAYVAFIVYVGVAASIAAHTRKRITQGSTNR